MGAVKEYNYGISIIRLISFVMIVLCHVFQFYNLEIAWWLNVGVEIFLCISGYLYGKKDSISNVMNFYRERVIKICTPYYIVIIPFIFLYYFKVPNKINIIKVVKLLVINDTLEGGGHLWFVPLILMCYIITPLLHSVFDGVKTKNVFIRRLIGICCFELIFYGLFVTYYNPAYIICYTLSFCIGVNENKKFIKNTNVLYISSSLCALNIIQIYFDYLINYHFEGIVLSGYKAFSLFNHVWLGIFIFILFKDYIFKNININGKLVDFLSFTDTYTYEAYLVHQFLILGPFSIMTLTKINIINYILIVIYIGISAIIVKKLSDILSKIFRKKFFV